MRTKRRENNAYAAIGIKEDDVRDEKASYMTEGSYFREREQDLIAKYLVLEQKYLLKEQQCLQYECRILALMAVKKEHQGRMQYLSRILQEIVSLVMGAVERKGECDMQLLTQMRNSIDAVREIDRMGEYSGLMEQMNVIINKERQKELKRNEYVERNQIMDKEKNQLLQYLRNVGEKQEGDQSGRYVQRLQDYYRMIVMQAKHIEGDRGRNAF